MTKFKNTCFIVASFICLCFLCFGLCSCTNDTQKLNTKTKEPNVSVPLLLSLNDGGEEDELNVYYDDSLFFNNAKSFNGDLALISCALAYASYNDYSSETFSGATKFYNDIGFTNVYVSQDFSPFLSNDGVAYTIAQKSITNKKSGKAFNVIALSIRGFGYGLEWLNNFTLGVSGNHSGFDESASVVLNGLVEYINQYNCSDFKLWVTGYSRGGGIANVLASKLISGNDVNVKQSDMFVYTISTPNTLPLENALPYENVFNIINSADLVVSFPPSEYGFSRCGVDVDIYDVQARNIISTYYSKINLHAFKKDKDLYPTPQLFVKYLINAMTKTEPNGSLPFGEFLDVSTREKYVQNFECDVQYLLGLFYTMKISTMNAIVNEFSKLSINEIIDLFKTDSLYEYLKPFLDNDSNVSYTETELKSCVKSVIDFVGSNYTEILKIVNGGASNLMYVIDMHYPQITIALLSNYVENHK